MARTVLAAVWVVLVAAQSSRAAQVVVQLSGATDGVTLVGVVQRWDQDGNFLKPIDPNAQIDRPDVTAIAKPAGGGRFVFDNLKPGTYDLVLLKQGRVRIEGWSYPPVLEFDPFFPPDATTDDETREWIEKDIRNARHYENKVVPLRMGGDEKTVRVLVMLIRDLPTSYEGEMPGAATLRFEVWQYDWNYGGWTKNRRTKVLHRVILTRDELRRWTWLWDPQLGHIEVGVSPKTIQYAVPATSDQSLKGLRPY